jgi:hypothetical protein
LARGRWCYKITMSRRFLAVLAACCIAALGVSAVALAHGGSSEHHGTKAPHKRAVHPGGGFLGVALDSLAARLDVTPADLRTAITAAIAEERAKHPGKHARPTPAQLAVLKTELATALATKLSKTPDEILTAVRAELDARLTQAVTKGWLTAKGHDLALACFDDPATCDVKALRAEVRFFGHKQTKRAHKQHHHKQHHHKHGHKPAPASTTTPPSTTAPPTTMTPGGRATSTPLR